VKAHVTLVEPLGAETLVHLALGSDKMIMRGGQDHIFEAGSEIALTAAPSDLRFFDPGGRRISAA